MKNKLLFRFVAILLAVSCTKTDPPLDLVDEVALTTVMASKDNHEFAINYSLLQAAEKKELWSMHVKYFIESHKLNEEQLSFVNNFLSRWVVSGLFEKNSSLLNEFTIALPTIKKTAFTVLGIADASELFLNLPADRKYYATGSVTSNESSNSNEQRNQFKSNSDYCKCSQTDPYCNIGTCASLQCTRQAGCGTLFLFECNGICQWLADN